MVKLFSKVREAGLSDRLNYYSFFSFRCLSLSFFFCCNLFIARPPDVRFTELWGYYIQAVDYEAKNAEYKKTNNVKNVVFVTRKNNLIKIVLWLAILQSSINCHSQNNSGNVNTLKITINSEVKGWYLLAVHNDSTLEVKVDVEVDMKGRVHNEINLKDYSLYKYSIYDLSGKDITQEIKLSGTYFGKRPLTILHFYNPSDKEMSQTNWEPLTPYVDSLMRKLKNTIKNDF